MSQDKMKRRRFLADSLFAGGALGAAALAARWLQKSEPEPVPPVCIKKTTDPVPLAKGEAPMVPYNGPVPQGGAPMEPR